LHYGGRKRRIEILGEKEYDKMKNKTDGKQKRNRAKPGLKFFEKNGGPIRRKVRGERQ